MAAGGAVDGVVGYSGAVARAVLNVPVAPEPPPPEPPPVLPGIELRRRRTPLVRPRARLFGVTSRWPIVARARVRARVEVHDLRSLDHEASVRADVTAAIDATLAVAARVRARDTAISRLQLRASARVAAALPAEFTAAAAGSARITVSDGPSEELALLLLL